MVIDEKYVAWVKKIAYNKSRTHNYLNSLVDDLTQEGMIGLMEAAGKYDSSINNSFYAFSKHYVRGRMLDFIRRWNKTDRKTGQPRQVLAHAAPLDSPGQSGRGSDEEEMERPPLHNVVGRDGQVKRLAFLDLLRIRFSEKEAHVLIECYVNRRTLKDIGKDLGLSESRVCQIRKGTLEKARHVLKREDLIDGVGI